MGVGMSKPLIQWRKATDDMMKFLNYAKEVKKPQTGYSYDFLHSCIHHAAPDLADDEIASIIKEVQQGGDVQDEIDRELDAMARQIGDES